MSNETPEHFERLTRQCREALGSLHCELPRREKVVLDQIVGYSFALGQEFAWFGSSEQIVLETGLHKTDVSSALSSLIKRRMIAEERAAPLFHFRRPMIYRLHPDALLRVAQPPAANGNPGVQRARAATAAWLVHANRCYPLQPELMPPDPRELDLALAEISRASALAQESVQNGEPKPGDMSTGAVYPPEQVARRPVRHAAPSIASPPPGGWMDPQVVARLARESLLKAGYELPPTPVSEPRLVGNSQTTSPPSLKLSNFSCAGDQMSSDHSDGEYNSPSGNPDGGLVGKNQTTLAPEVLVEVNTLLAKLGEKWSPPTTTQALFEEVCRSMGAAAMGNYGSWWYSRCADPETRQDVRETLAAWKLGRIHPKAKPWGGGKWRDRFNKLQRARQAASAS